jgi:hypothetical protein
MFEYLFKYHSREAEKFGIPYMEYFEMKWRGGEGECEKGCGLKILMEAHSLFFPTFM